MPQNDFGELVFTYGTLRRGQCNHFMMRDAEYLGIDTIQAKFVDTGFYAPGITEGTDEIPGEVYLVSLDLLERLDHFEGVGYGYYKRVEVITQSEGLRVYVYYFNVPNQGDSPDVR